MDTLESKDSFSPLDEEDEDGQDIDQDDDVCEDEEEDQQQRVKTPIMLVAEYQKRLKQMEAAM